MIKLKRDVSVEALAAELAKKTSSRWGMLCDDAFLGIVVSEMFEIFDREDLDDPTMQWDTCYDGDLECTFTGSVSGEIVLQVNPQYRENGDRVTLTACVVGEFIISRHNWGQWLYLLDRNSSSAKLEK